MSHIRIAAAALTTTLLLLPVGLWAEPPAGVTHVAPNEVSFQPMASDKDAEMATLYGDPSKSGIYVLRFKVPANWTGRPHLHGGTELMTVQSGSCYMAYDADLTRKAAKALPAGSFTVLPGGHPMRAFSGEGGCVLDVQGEGPFTIHYLDEAGKKAD